MAIRSYNGPYGVRTLTSRTPDGKWVTTTSTASSRMYEEYSSKTDTIRRTRPSKDDLLFSGTSYSVSRWSKTNTYCTFVWVDGTVEVKPVGDTYGTGSAGNKLTYPGLTSRFYSELKNQKVNLAQALAEYRQTATMFHDIGTRVAGAWRSFRRGDPVSLVRAIRGSNRKWLSSNWLAYQYGVRPLVSDIVGSMELLDRRLQSHPILFRGKVSQRADARTYSSIPSGNIANIQVGRRSYKYYYTVDNSLIKTASSLGLTNPLSLAWELVPYSFVVDWFINVGDWLGSIDALYGIKRLGYHQIDHRWETNIVSYRGGSYSYDGYDYSRSGLNTTLPNLRLQWEPSLSWQRITSALALLRQSRKT